MSGELSQSYGVQERRRSPRLRVRELNSIDLHHAGEPLPVRDVSLDGFAIECEKYFEPGTLHMFSLLPSNGSAVTSLVQVVRSDRAPGRSLVVTGFRFSLIQPHTRSEVEALIRSVSAESGLAT